MKVYISGRISSHPEGVDAAHADFVEAAGSLQDAGHFAVSPFDCDPFPAVHFGMTSRQQWRAYMRGDLREMLLCDGVALLDGWEGSPGAQIESHLARQVDLDVRPIAEWLS